MKTYVECYAEQEASNNAMWRAIEEVRENAVSLRDQFACAAMQAAVQSLGDANITNVISGVDEKIMAFVAQNSWAWADAMLKQREQKE